MTSSSGYLRHFIACNRHDLSGYAPLAIAGKDYGLVRKDVADILCATNHFIMQNSRVALAPHYRTFAARSEILLAATDRIATHYGKNLRHELYPVIQNWGDDPVAQIDRVAVPWFGVRAWGIHVNGFVRKADGIYLWIGERAADRLAEPGKLDNMIGGGQPIGLTLAENLCKEAQEEAGMEPALALTAKQIKTIDYRLERKEGLRRDSLFIYDLELPEDFTPRNTDGEVAAFHLMPLSQVAALVHDTDKFKFNCNLVIIDFLLRHGFITSAHKEYGGLMDWMER